MTCRAPVLVLAAFFPVISLADPLPATDQNPWLAGFALPEALPARPKATKLWSSEAVFSWANSTIIESTPRETLVVDAETRELRMTLERGLTNGYAVRVQIPYRWTSAGSLDGFIDDWHDLFGLPEGARPARPRDEFQMFYRRDGRVYVNALSSSEGIGDVSMQLGKSLTASDRTAVAAWATLKLPTGDADDFAGSGSIDASVALALEHRLSPSWSLFGQAAVTWLDEGDRLRDEQRHWIWSGSAGVSARTWEHLTLTLQVDAHSAVFDSADMNYLGDAVLLTIGGNYAFASAWVLSAGVSEDIAVESAPDVTFLFGLRKTF